MFYYIVGNRAFNILAEAEKYCIACDLDFACIIEAEAKTTKTEKFYEFYTMSVNRQIGYFSYLTEAQVNSPLFQKEIQNYKNGEYYAIFGHLKEISEKEYLKHKTV